MAGRDRSFGHSAVDQMGLHLSKGARRSAPALSSAEVATAPFTLACVPQDQILALVNEKGSGWLPEGSHQVFQAA